MTALWNLVLLADREADFTAMGDHFRAESAHLNIPHFFVLGLSILTVASLIWALTRWQDNDFAWNLDNPQRLFWDLCRRHELNTNETTLLRKVSRELQLAHPASLFVDPRLLISAMQLEKFHDLHGEISKLGEIFFGFHLWQQAMAADNNRMQEESIVV